MMMTMMMMFHPFPPLLLFSSPLKFSKVWLAFHSEKKTASRKKWRGPNTFGPIVSTDGGDASHGSHGVVARI